MFILDHFDRSGCHSRLELFRELCDNKYRLILE